MSVGNSVSSFIARHHMIPPGATVLCAVSGGADSVCLLHILHGLQSDLDFHLVAAHYNHHLRGAESDEDEAFVWRLCKNWGIPCHLGSGDVHGEAKARKLGIEETAREMRYTFLFGMSQVLDKAIIATAHNADDNAETVLLNLIRGTGLRGLTGISPVREGLIRPLLNTPRSEILAYLEENGIPHREDSSNADVTYTRNKLRAQVMPLLRELNPQATEHINTAAAHLKAVDEFLDQAISPYLAQGCMGEDWAAFPMKVLLEVPQALRPPILFHQLEVMGVGRKDVGTVHLEALLSLKEGGHSDLPGGVIATCRDGFLVLAFAPPPPPDETPLPMDRSLTWGNWTLTVLDHPDGQGLALPVGGALTVRRCQPRERLTLPSSNGARTVKRLCLDKRITLSERDNLPAFYVDGKLAAVWPIGVDVDFIPKRDPIRFIQIQYTEENET